METPTRPLLPAETRLFEVARRQFSDYSNAMIREASDLAAEKLAGEVRYNGEPFLTHPVETALIVCNDIGLGRNSTVATLVQDAVRMGRMGLDEVEKRFGPEVAKVTKALCQISDIDPKISTEQVDNFRELILSYATDPRVILIKLADRLEVMRSLEDFPAEKRQKKSWETLHLYAEIAHKLGLYAIKSEMEDLALKYSYPDEYAHIVQKLADTAAERQQFIHGFLVPIEAKLAASGLKYHIKSRTKSVYSIWKKMKQTGVPFEEVFDVFAIRIVLDCPPEQEKQACWNVYSIATDFYTPNPERMRDWISIPKSNGYESLHATVVTKTGKWVEVQIRTERMDEVAERGVAAHWRYKGVKQTGLSSEEWLARLRELIENTDNVLNIAQKLDTGISSKEIFVFTPTGDLRKLREGATVLDFAYEIHSRIGETCTGARINHRIVSIREKLANGDVVEILTAKNQKPKPDWLNIVVTGKARQRIKVFLREEQAKAADLGREILERKMRNWKLTLTMDEAISLLCKYYKIKTGTEFYSLLAEEKFSLSEVKDIVSGNLTSAYAEKPRSESKTKKESDNDGCLVIDDTLKQVSYKFGKCCNPIFGDEIFAFVTVTAGITVHRADCPNGTRLRERYPYRMLPARWRNDTAKGAFRATIRIQGEDRPGLVNQITETITKDLKINIRSMNLGNAAGSLSGLINIEVTSTQMVDMVIHNLLKIKGVQKAYRINN
ncbi:MAG: RelA/SpoT family protein [Rikenellaceae bacterium]|jgi:GTP pyrophosphokinase|nr:RelA/SpoT family protein [Rikenellaceae bacterium]